MTKLNYFSNILDNFKFLTFILLRKKNKKLIGFADDYFEGNTKHIFLSLKKYHECFWVSRFKKTVHLLRKNKFYSLNYFTLILKFVKVDCWITSNSGRIPSLFKTINISTDHGIPIKAFTGKKKISHVKTLNKFFHLLPGYQTYDFYKNYYKINKKKLFITGYARNDYLFKLSKKERLSFFRKLKLNSKHKTIIYAPTWSHDHKNQFKKGLFPKKWGDELIVLDHLAKFFNKKKINFIIRLHKYHDVIWNNNHDNILKKYSNIVKVSSSSHPNSIIFLKYTDLLITDYSSIYNDFLILNRPIIFIKSLSKIFNKFISTNFPGPSVTSIKDLKKFILISINNKNFYKYKRERVKNYTHINTNLKFTQNCVNTINKILKNEK